MTSPMPAGLLLAALAALPGTGQAAEAMSGAAFGAYVGGKTLTYAHDGVVYGMEQYLPQGRVIWRHVDGPCEEGVWFERDGQICFDYGDGIPLQCWQFVEEGGRLGARSQSDPSGTWLYEVRRSSEPMDCPAPYLGT
ncbi:hypothetical protein [Mangrovicoccus algicola]|uniref:Uncharacterized protein n=1 Tax=Mangrovicoccus algicola TaxID=2771008 RepID=A0A8J6YZC1_9RHOB|nr:hypothetical protein [Mangrovicoccus algicola]MBE3640612.1 hypothetical protein [Mangrovicoccus algicola]